VTATLQAPPAARRPDAPFLASVSPETELRAIAPGHADLLLSVIAANRAHLARWHPWAALMTTREHADRLIQDWQRHHERNGALHLGIWHEGRFCGMIDHLNVDWVNRWTVFSYWLSESHQGRGIMTGCVRTMVRHAFTAWNLNRITIESATENTRSRAIPERLGFRLEGTVRGIEKLQDRYVDHAIYGLLRSDWAG
jgi:ribosomal-protein-serine acetyltransferase